MTTFADKPTITGERVVLEPITIDHARAMFASLDDAESNRLTGTHTEFLLSEIETWAASRPETDDRLDLAVLDRATGDWLGEVVVNDWDPENRSCGFRIALAPTARDSGFGTEATQLIVDYVFDEIDTPPVNRLQLEVFVFNPRALAVYERVGFKREGIMRQALRWDGEFVDAVLMSIIRSDRPEHLI